MMSKNPIPSAPISPLQLPATAVAVARPFIHYDYLISKRHNFCCYSKCFLLTKKDNIRWNLILYDVDKSSYDIPTEKTNEDMTMIINSLGVKKNSIYKIDVFNRDKFIQKKHFISLQTIIEFITKNEFVVEGVVHSG